MNIYHYQNYELFWLEQTCTIGRTLGVTGTLK